jgi:hypothetical protein
MPTTITPDFPLRELAYRVIREQPTHLRANEPGTRAGTHVLLIRSGSIEHQVQAVWLA